MESRKKWCAQLCNPMCARTPRHVGKEVTNTGQSQLWPSHFTNVGPRPTWANIWSFFFLRAFFFFDQNQLCQTTGLSAVWCGDRLGHFGGTLGSDRGFKAFQSFNRSGPAWSWARPTILRCVFLLPPPNVAVSCSPNRRLGSLGSSCASSRGQSGGHRGCTR